MRSNMSVIRQTTPIRIGYRRTSWWKRISLLLIIAVAVTIGILQIRAPMPLDADASPERFSAARAMEKVEVIASEPRPLGSPAHEKAQDYLMAELEALGLHPEIQTGYFRGHTVQNIIARIPGTASTKAVMLAAHYDSVADSPGAADDASGIASMLETVRALQASEPLANDVILLMTDGEEPGLFGAHVFMNSHPWANDAGVVLNFEARGNKGPVFMFETSEGNGWLIDQFKQASPYPVGYSIVYNVYKLMPNDTDLTVFRENGLAGLNFAFGIGLNAYHSELDTPANLDLSSVQHQGEYMLSLTKHFGGLNWHSEPTQQQDKVYFNVFGWQMVSYKESWVIPLVGVAFFVFAATMWHGLSRGRLTWKGTAGGLLLALLALAAVIGIVTLLWRIVLMSVQGDAYFDLITDPVYGLYLFLGLIAVMIAVIVILIRLLSRYIRVENIWSGTLLLWLLLSLGTALYLPGGSYLFLWPLLFSLAGLNASFLLRGDSLRLAAVCSAVPGLILLSPICYLLYQMMTLDLSGAIMTIAALGATLVLPLFYKGTGRDGYST